MVANEYFPEFIALEVVWQRRPPTSPIKQSAMVPKTHLRPFSQHGIRRGYLVTGTGLFGN